MNDQHSGKFPHLDCAECERRLQDYLDGGLAKPESMQIFLHVRECARCAAELKRLEDLVALLEALPAHEPPRDFDARVLAAVPYASYRAMARLRRARVPVFLEADRLPAWIRSPAVRYGGLAAAAVAAAAAVTDLAPAGVLAIAAVGLVPEAATLLQGLGRRVALAVGQPRNGA
ncbi:MAG TPA: zf-HC2 domain-containing protein [Candidatus Krumholzibacteria bacterium]|nr:zf-HC2 domain-containing protein [Candidatus Krumholzibacteria bacterium]HPD71190.1 zf-HC2 domain-containing protein [Candidatus Krumholzibacteria bacterium]HRY39110.1 zf-HC2 domain-containing protein [Candidatus Krumholzibacteria bacterium]